MNELKTNDQKCEDIQKIKDDLLTKVFEKYGTFFAFSDKQFNEQKKDGVKYVSLGAGMITPKDTADAMLKELDKAIDTAQAKDKELNSKEQIILRELINYECFYVCSPAEAIENLKPYNYTESEIIEVYNNHFKEYHELQS